MDNVTEVKGINMDHLIDKGDIVISKVDTNPFFGALTLLVKRKNDFTIHQITKRPKQNLIQAQVTLNNEEFAKIITQLIE